MARATEGLILEAAFGADWNTTSPTWTALTSRLISGNITRGRGTPLEAFPVGSASFVLGNDDGEMDPANTGGTYFGDLKEGLRLRLRCDATGTSRGLGVWSVTSWETRFLHPDESVVVIGCAENGTHLERAVVGESGFVGVTKSGTRVGDILDEAGWPAGWRDVAAGQTPLSAAAAAADQRALSLIQSVAAADGMGITSAVFVDRDGNLVFHDPGAVAGTRMVTSQRTFSELAADAATAAKGRDLVAGFYTGVARSKATVELSTGPHIETSAAAAAAIGPASYSADTSAALLPDADLYLTDSAKAAFAALGTSRYGMKSVAVKAVGKDANLDRAVDVELRDRVTVKTTTPYGTTVNEEYHIQGQRVAWDARGGHGVILVTYALHTAAFLDALSPSSWLVWDSGKWDTDVWSY